MFMVILNTRLIIPVALDFNCTEMSINIHSNEDQVVEKHAVASSEKCSKECSLNAQCLYWTWHNTVNSETQTNCVLISNFIKITYETSVISGTKPCNGKMVILNY